MFENITYEMILDRMLDRVPNTIDKREGSIIYDALAPAAVELQLMYIELDTILDETFADTASRTYLIRRAAERGIVPNAATKAVLKGVFNMDVPIGSRYSLEDLNYVVTEKLIENEFKLQCEKDGTEGNRHFGTLIPIDYIDGLTSAELVEVLVSGEDEEDTEEFRKRYFNSLDSQAFGGNITDYKNKVNELQGVGGIKVYPVWNGGGTVRLVVINSDYSKPSIELIDSLQAQIDPVTSQGQGIGIAPIGHTVTVAGATDQVVNIAANITCQDGWTWEDVRPYVESKIDEYLLELKKGWADTNNIIVRISQIENQLLDVPGIIDIANTSINGLQENLVVGADMIPIRGVING
ncbi:MAG: putative phage Mu protein -like protein [Clostridia bacterium]|jgi:uncharacterized phage protein gp47/JayE|nr:putative phage Mu protein -like protein [Clostridia bacterium]